MTEFDPVSHPRHYVEQSATVEPIEILRWAPFDLGNALKYLIRAGHKGDKLEDLKKALWYLKCADESNYFQPEPYWEYFKKYGCLLVKFKGIPAEIHFDFDSVNFYKIIASVEEQIKELEEQADVSKQEAAQEVQP